MGYFGIPFRNGVPIGLGSVASFGAQQFDPSSLFIGGTVGTFYDPSDPTTLFTTSTGTTPCAVPGSGSQVLVGLMLDKSQGAPGALGAELVTNGDFSSGTTGWTTGLGWSISSGQAIASAASTLLTQSGVFTAGKWYRVSFQQTYTSGSLQIRINGVQSIGFASFSGTITFNVYATASGQIEFVGTSLTSVIDNISVRELPGNHAIAFNDTTARPELSARVNRLERTEEISNAYWTKTQLASFAASGVTPNGVTAFNLVPNTNVDSHRLSRSAINIAGPKTMRVVAKANGYNFLSITDLTTFSAGIDLITGTQWGGAGTAVITSLGNGWWEIKVSGTATASTSFAVEPLSSASFLAYAGDGVSGVLVGEFDDRFSNIGSALPSYQRIADQYTYDSNGFPSYLRFDGVDDSMYTPANLNLSGTDKVAVFAGVRKLSDAAAAIISEFSASAGTNNGTLYFAGPTAYGAADFVFASKGTTIRIPTATGLSAPLTRVISGIGDISGDLAQLRVNGAVAATETGDQGSGNYGTYPLFIGARNNSEFWLNGHLHSLIIAGSAVSAGNISATEQWVAGKTGVQI